MGWVEGEVGGWLGGRGGVGWVEGEVGGGGTPVVDRGRGDTQVGASTCQGRLSGEGRQTYGFSAVPAQVPPS